ncbi:MAG: TatD family hydrolase [Gammaproteobacteria bacterium]|nr:TatD family hydrolase [Gammaproteobacteria bacterium]MBQ0773739.1 TatD family hydrolase [Gammaproteobacteria bacterium]
MNLTDIGVNLADKRFLSDMTLVLERAAAAGVTRQIITGTSLEGSRSALQLAANNLRNNDAVVQLYATCGIHPHQASDFSTSALSELRLLAQQPGIVAIGETGLDFNRDFSPRPEQEKAFAEQLQLATELSLPVFLHQRDAHERFLPLLKEHRDTLKNVVVHCFTGNRKELFDYLDLDCHIGITGWVCDERRGKPLQEIVKNIPLNRLLIETDSPYLTPRNMPGKPPKSGRNEPSLLIYVAQKLAEIYAIKLDEIAISTQENSTVFFSIEA